MYLDDLNRDSPTYPKQQLRFTVGITPSVNHMHIGRTKKLTHVAEQYIQKTQNICAAEMKRTKFKKDKDYVWWYMDLYFFMPDKRIRDSHNCLKLLMDALQGILFRNDYYVMPRIQNVVLDKANPRIEIVFHPQEVM